MNKCISIELLGAVSDTSIRRINELHVPIKVSGNGLGYLQLNINILSITQEPIILSFINNGGDIYDENYTLIGKTETIATTGVKIRYIRLTNRSEDTFSIQNCNNVSSVYAVNRMDNTNSPTVILKADQFNVFSNTTGFTFPSTVSGSIDGLNFDRELNSFTSFGIEEGSAVTGNIANLPTTLYSAFLRGNLYGSINDLKCYGLSALTIEAPNIGGDMNAFANFTWMDDTIIIRGTQIKGDFKSLKNLKVQILVLQSGIYGDVVNLPKTCFSFELHSSEITYSGNGNKLFDAAMKYFVVPNSTFTTAQLDLLLSALNKCTWQGAGSSIILKGSPTGGMSNTNIQSLQAKGISVTIID